MTGATQDAAGRESGAGCCFPWQRVWQTASILLSLCASATAGFEDVAKAQAAYEAKQYKEAIAICTRGIKADGNPQLLILRGMCYYDTGIYDLAVRDYTEVLASAPLLPVLYRRGIAYKALGQYDSAIVDLQKALKKAPDMVTVRSAIIDIRLKQGLRDEAAEEFRQMLGQGTFGAADLLNVADSCLNSGDTAIAIVALERAAAIDSARSWVPLSRRGFILQVGGKADSAEYYYGKALRSVAADKDGARDLAEFFAVKKQYRWAVRAYSVLERFAPDEPSINNSKALAFFYVRELDSAAGEFTVAARKLLSRGEVQLGAEAYFRLGEVYYAMEKFEQADASFKRAKDLFPAHQFRTTMVDIGGRPVSRVSQSGSGDSLQRKRAPVVAADSYLVKTESPSPIPLRDSIAAVSSSKGYAPDTVLAEPTIPLRLPPRLLFTWNLDDGNKDGVLDGGERVVLSVSVTNRGGQAAKGVRVLLSGSSKALPYLGTTKTIGDVAPGEQRAAAFEAVLPYEVQADEGSLVVQVTESMGFGALEVQELRVALQPAKVVRKVSVVSGLVDVDQPLGPVEFTRGDAYAVVIGISDYRLSSNLPKVTYARKDAEAMRDYLVGVCGFRESNIKLLTDDGASKSDLEAYLEEWLPRNVRKGSFVFVYFAGHGTPSPEKGEAYIVPYDGEPGFVSKLYPLSRLYSSLTKLPTDQVVVALDACFSGAGGRSVMEQGKRPLVAVDLEKEAQKLGNVAVLTASAGNEISQDSDSKRHGLFTYYLLKGLRGEADTDADGWVTLGELYRYARPKVLDESQRLGHGQTLQLLPEASGARANMRVGKVQ